jgi:hypothetical protein
MWALGVSFSAVWIGLLVAQALACSVQVLGVSRLQASVLGPLGVMFTLCLDLCRASWSSHKVLDELSREVSLLALKPCVNNKLQKPHASENLHMMRIRVVSLDIKSMPTPKVNSWLGWQKFTVNISPMLKPCSSSSKPSMDISVAFHYLNPALDHTRENIMLSKI